MLKPSEKEFPKEVDNLRVFTFRYPTLRDEIKADNIAAALLEGNKNPSIVASNAAVMIGLLTVCTVKAPEGFDLDEAYIYEEVEAAYNALIDQVLSFRGQSAFTKQPGAEDPGAGRSQGA